MEQDANQVLMLHTDDVEQKYQEQRFIKLFVRKNRDGRLTTINYRFKGDYVQFEETVWDDKTKRYVALPPTIGIDSDISDEEMPY